MQNEEHTCMDQPNTQPIDTNTDLFCPLAMNYSIKINCILIKLPCWLRGEKAIDGWMDISTWYMDGKCVYVWSVDAAPNSDEG